MLLVQTSGHRHRQKSVSHNVEVVFPQRAVCYHSPMPRTALLEWEGREYDHNPKSTDWYWALGIIAVAGTVASVLFGNYLLALLIIIAAVALAFHAAKRPPL